MDRRPAPRRNPGEHITGRQRRLVGIEPAQVHEQLTVGEGRRGTMREMNRQGRLADAGDTVDRRDHHRRALPASGQRIQRCQLRLTTGKPEDIMR